MNTTPASAKALSCSVTDMDALSQQGFGKIAALARGAVELSNGEKYARNRAHIVALLEAIFDAADEYSEYINNHAEKVGFSWKPDAAEGVH